MISTHHENPNPLFNTVNHVSTTFFGETVFGEGLEEVSENSGSVAAALNGCTDEFTKGSNGLDSSADVFTLQPLFQHDDLNIFGSVFSVITACIYMMWLTVIQVVENSNVFVMHFS